MTVTVHSSTTIPDGAKRRLADAIVSDCPPLPWVIMSAGPIFAIKRSAATLNGAQTLFTQLGLDENDHFIFGPASDVVLSAEDYRVEDPIPCHLCDTEPCSIEPIEPPASPLPFRSQIVRIVMTYEFSGSVDPITYHITPDPAGRLTDALFLTPGARRRFMYPYYYAVYGHEYVTALRGRYNDGGRP